MNQEQSKRSRYWIDPFGQCSFVTDDTGHAIALVTPPGWLEFDVPGIHRRFDGVAYVAAERFAALPASTPDCEYVSAEEVRGALQELLDAGIAMRICDPATGEYRYTLTEQHQTAVAS